MKWIPVAEYAKQLGVSRGKIYQDIVYQRIPTSHWKKTKVEKIQMMILVPVNKSEKA